MQRLQIYVFAISVNIFRLFLIDWTKSIKAGGDSTVKKRKLNYTIHNPNTVEETAKILMDILIQANEEKVERKFKELQECFAADELEG